MLLLDCSLWCCSTAGTMSLLRPPRSTPQPLPNVCFREEVKAAFEVFDLNGDGTISVEDLRHTMTTMGDVMSDKEVRLAATGALHPVLTPMTD